MSEKKELPVVGGGPGGERCDRCYYGECNLTLDDMGLWGPHLPEQERMTVEEYEATDTAFVCYRYPKALDKYSFDWCGEFKPLAEAKSGGEERTHHDLHRDIMSLEKGADPVHGFEVRLKRALHRYNIKTIQELLSADVQHWKQFGELCVRSLIRRIGHLGYAAPEKWKYQSHNK